MKSLSVWDISEITSELQDKADCQHRKTSDVCTCLVLHGCDDLRDFPKTPDIEKESFDPFVD